MLYKLSINGKQVAATLKVYIEDEFFRFRQIPTFGRGTIRCFRNNTSEMKKLAAQDFEDILQVTSIQIMPA